MTRKWNYPRLTTEELQKLGGGACAAFRQLPSYQRSCSSSGYHEFIESAEKFFHPLSARPSTILFLMPDMDKAVERLNRRHGFQRKKYLFTGIMMSTAQRPSLLSTGTYRISIPNWTSTSPRATRKATNITFHNRPDSGTGCETCDRILDCGIKANDEIAYAPRLA